MSDADDDDDDLLTEISAINAIYTPTTIFPHHSSTPSTSTSTSIGTTYTLTLPSSSSPTTSDSSISLLLSFPTTYPAQPPTIDGTASIGTHAKRGSGQRVLEIARVVLSEVWREGEVVLFDFVEELGGRLMADGVVSEDEGEGESGVAGYDSRDYGMRRAEGKGGGGEMYDASVGKEGGPDMGTPHMLHQHQRQPPNNDNNKNNTATKTPPSLSTSSSSSSFPPPVWTLSTPLTIKKSLFLARACPISSPAHAASCLEHLLATDKHARKATHNISAYRSHHHIITTKSTKDHQHDDGPRGGEDEEEEEEEEVESEEIDDHDSDGEDAAGGRLLNLLHLMDIKNVLVVVSRWYGGVKLGGARFGAIGGVAREVLGMMNDE